MTGSFARYVMVVGLCLSGCGDDFGGRVFAPGVRGMASEQSLAAGHRMMDAGEYELALRAYTRAAATQGTTAQILGAIGSANLALGRLGQAETILRKAVEKDDVTPEIWNNLGVVLMETGQIPEAVLVFRRAFATSSGNSQVIRDNLAKALAKRDDPNYDGSNENGTQLIHRGTGNVLLVSG